MKHHCTTSAASLQARHRVLRRAVARVPASIAELLSSSDNQQTPNVVCCGAPYDDNRAPTTSKTSSYDDICRPMIVGGRMSSALVLRTTVFGVRQPAELLRWLSERGRRLLERAGYRIRMLLRCTAARVQCPVQRAQCCPTKHPDGYIEALF